MLIILVVFCSNTRAGETSDRSPFANPFLYYAFPAYGYLTPGAAIARLNHTGESKFEFSIDAISDNAKADFFSIDKKTGVLSIDKLPKFAGYKKYELKLSAKNRKSNETHDAIVFLNSHKNPQLNTWFNPFPAQGIGKVYTQSTRYSQYKTLENIVFENDGHYLKALYNWPHNEAPFSMIMTATDYSHYDFELEYKWGERKFAPRQNKKRDAGIIFHARGDLEVWPVSLECQIQEGDTGDHYSIRGPSVVGLLKDGKETVANSKTQEGLRGGARLIRYAMSEVKGWNKVRLEIRGDSAKYFVNGVLVNQFKQAVDFYGQALTSGKIGLQAEGAEITYRNIRMRLVK